MNKLTKNQEAVIAVNEFVFYFIESATLLSLILSGEENTDLIITSDFENYFLTNRDLYCEQPPQGYSKVFNGLLKIEWDKMGLDFILLPSSYEDKENARLSHKIEMDLAQGDQSKSSLYYLLSSEYAMKHLCSIAIGSIDKIDDVTIARHQFERIGANIDLIRDRLIEYTPNNEYITWYKALNKYYNSFKKELQDKVQTPITSTDAVFLLNLLIKAAGLECKPGAKQKLLANIVKSTEGTVKGYFHQFKEREGEHVWESRLLRIAESLGDDSLRARFLGIFEKEKGFLFPV